MSTTRITWEDALLTPEDGNRYEAIDGELYVTPAPTLRHPWISANLEAALRRILVEPGHIKRKLDERQGVAQYWLVDPETETIHVRDFAAGATGPTGYTDRVPVTLQGTRLGEIALREVFATEV